MSRNMEDENGDDFGADEGEDYDEDYSEEEELDIVRQDSNYSKLSAESWLKVHSEYDDNEDAAEEDPLAGTGMEESGEDYFWNDIALRLRERQQSERSVLECLVELLSGSGASKKGRMFSSGGEKRVWVSPDVRTLQWTSKKKGTGRLELSQIRSIRGSTENRTVVIETVDRKRTGLAMPNAADLQLWVRCLACFSSLQAQIICPGVTVAEREDYDLSLDLWDERPLRKMHQVDDYYILSHGETPTSRAMLALSRTEKQFHGLKLLNTTISTTLRPEELAVLKKLKHPNVLNFKEFIKCPEKEGLYTVFDYVPRGVVISGYKLESNKAIPEDMARRLINDVAAGLLYLHARGIAHGDVRPDNLLFATDGSLKINPLGAVFYDHSSRRQPLIFASNMNAPSTFAFTPPERCRDAKKAPKPPETDYDSDTWSLGALLYFMVFGRAPFLGDTAQTIQDQITTAKLSFPETPKVSKRAKDLMRKILGEKDHRRRVKLEAVVNHPWLTEASGPVSLFSSNKRRLYTKSEVEKRKVAVSDKEVKEAIKTGRFTDPSKEDPT